MDDSDELSVLSRTTLMQVANTDRCSHLKINYTLFSYFWRFAFIILSIISASLIYVIGPSVQKGTTYCIQSLFNILFFALITLMLTLIFNLIIIIFHNFIPKLSRFGRVFARFIHRNDWWVSFELSLIISSCIESVYSARTATPIQSSVPADPDKVPPTLEEIIANISWGLAIAIGIFLIKGIIVDLLNYNMHYSYFSNRINTNENKMAIINRLMAISGSSHDEEISQACGKIMHMIAENESNEVSFDDIKAYLGMHMAIQFYDFIGLKITEKFTDQNLKTFLSNTRTENEQLQESMAQTATSVGLFDRVATLLCVLPAITAVLVWMPSGKNTGQMSLTFITSSVLSIGFFFADTIKNVLDSLIFIFGTRPFEANDLIILNGKVYRVKEINIMTTTLLDHHLETVYQNTQLKAMAITNLRSSNLWEMEFEYKFNIKRFKEVRETFLSRIKEYTKERRNLYNGEPRFGDVKLVSGSEMSVILLVKFDFIKRSVKSVEKCKEKFVFFIHSLMEELDLCPS